MKKADKWRTYSINIAYICDIFPQNKHEMKHFHTYKPNDKKRNRLAAAALSIALGSTPAQAQQTAAHTAAMTDSTTSDSTTSDSTRAARHTIEEAKQMLRQCFSTLTVNRKTYNQYNDSVFTITNHDDWVEFFKRRAIKNHQLFMENKLAIETIRKYFDKANGYKPNEVYNTLSNEMGSYIETSDPFLSMHLLRVLEDYYTSGECPDSVNNLLATYNAATYFCKQIYNISGDETYIAKGYQLIKATLNADPKKYQYYNYCLTHALRTSSTLSFINTKVETIDEAKEHNTMLLKILNDPSVIYDNAFINEADVKETRHIAESFNERVVRNYYINDTTVIDNAIADSIMRATISRSNAAAKTDYRTRLRHLLFKVTLGDITMKEARKEALTYYKSVRATLMASKNLTPQQMQSFILPFFTFFYINDMADVPNNAKCKTVKAMCNDIVTAYNKVTNQQQNTDHIKYLNQLVTYQRVNKYLTPNERVNFLNRLIVSTQVTTYAHSVHVGTIAKMLMQSILDHEPELLTGMLGCRDANEVKRKKKDFMTFIHEAALYHDLGKNLMIPIVTNDYRPLYDEEFAIIKRHPELGLQYLELSPDLARYHDTTLGHHKWYNGKGGYPDSFDNTKSPYRTLIDLLTLSDCMQAATEQVGRNYKGEKTFDTVMEEFRQQAGTRFNPDLVRFIDEHADLADQLRDNLNTDWYNIYYDIYSQYIKK